MFCEQARIIRLNILSKAICAPLVPYRMRAALHGQGSSQKLVGSYQKPWRSCLIFKARIPWYCFGVNLEESTRRDDEIRSRKYL